MISRRIFLGFLVAIPLAPFVVEKSEKWTCQNPSWYAYKSKEDHTDAWALASNTIFPSVKGYSWNI